MTRYLVLLTSLLASVAGCADNINHERPDAAVATDDATVTSTTKVITTRNSADGSYTTVVDATSMTDWTYGDFDTGMEAAPSDPWDLRFQRFHISTNGGVSGDGGVEVAPLTGVTFDEVSSAPATGYVSDAADGNADGMPDYAFEQGDGWYDYNVDSHVLTPKPIVWIVKTDGGSTLKFEILKYYDDAGTSGWFSLHWKPM